MPAQKVTDEQFIAAWQGCPVGSTAKTIAAHLGITERCAFKRRASIEKRHGISLGSAKDAERLALARCERRAELAIPDGVVVVFSDAHYWPGIVSTAHRALVKLLPAVKPRLVVGNGDILDGATISRHPRLGWQKLPKLADELAAAQQRLAEVVKASPKALHRLTPGNHDMRFDGMMSNVMPQLEGIPGMSLWDHFAAWQVSLSLMLNGNTMIKHRYHNGVHAAYNNTVKAGTHIVTGHLHRLMATTWGDYNGLRFGIDTGTLADTDGPQFLYGEDNPKPHSSGFVVLTYRAGMLLDPEFCRVREDGHAYFRGQLVV